MLAAARALAGIAVAACAEGRDWAEGPDRGGRYRGVELTPARPKPDFTLTATDARPFAFRRETEGRLALLFFGYTHCPDICPIHLANIAAVLHRLPSTMGERIRVVFVTTDPARDTPARLREWLDHLDPDFIGLTGTEAQITAAQEQAGLFPAIPGRPDSTGGYTVGHAAQVLAFTPDDSLRVLYSFGTRQQDWAHDLPMLLQRGGEGVK